MREVDPMPVPCSLYYLEREVFELELRSNVHLDTAAPLLHAYSSILHHQYKIAIPITPMA
jgi:hypothetical protein